jgi:hypothetical protein
LKVASEQAWLGDVFAVGKTAVFCRVWALCQALVLLAARQTTYPPMDNDGIVHCLLAYVRLFERGRAESVTAANRPGR